MSLLYITDNGLGHPIFRAQGLPLLKDTGNSSLLYFKKKADRKELFFDDKKILSEYKNDIDFFPVEVGTGRIPVWLRMIFHGFLSSSRIIRNKKITIVHCRSLIPGFIGLIIKLVYSRKIRLIYDNRGVFIEEEIYKGNWVDNSIKVKIVRFWEKVLIQKCDIMVVVSNKFADYIQKEYNITQKIRVIPNRTNMSRIYFCDNQVNKNEVTFIYSGSVAAWQSINDLFNLFDQLSKNIVNARFYIISYEHKELFDPYITKYRNLKNKIEIINSDSDNVGRLLQKGNFGVLLRENHLLNEVSSPLKFAEYLAAGMAVIVSENVGDSSEVILNHKVGVIVKNNNYEEVSRKCLELTEDNELRLRCRETAEKLFDYKLTLLEYKKIYKELS